MSNITQVVTNKRRKNLSPKAGGRGIKDTDRPRDKNVRITSELYEEMMEYIRRKHYNADFHDICSEAWKFYRRHHRNDYNV